MWLTPFHQHTEFNYPLDFDSKVQIFYEQTDGWVLNIAEQTVNTISHSGFAVLSIVFSYFETIGKYQDGYTGIGQSRHYFKRGVHSVFPNLQTIDATTAERILDELYSGCRCGLYHNIMTGGNIVLGGGTNQPILYNQRIHKLVINPEALVPALKIHLNLYVQQLRDPHNTVLRNNFERRFDFNRATP